MAKGERGRGYATDLTDAQWAIPEPLLPARTGPGRPRTVDLRRVVDALLYLNRTGCRGRLLPHGF
jgi:transposase